ncbi:MAG: type ISP restriction/modification enzyme [Candidatus Roizmanbacteria bacterium]|nr:type ISP restriction/modification enzyme [Candidatus Roizmanbacteria bacterium]
MQTDRDSLFIDTNKTKLQSRIMMLLGKNYSNDFSEHYRVKNSSSYKILERIRLANFNTKYLSKITYRPFDDRRIYYDEKVISRPAYSIMKHFSKENISINLCRQQSTFVFQHIFVSKYYSERCTISSQTKE